MATKKTTKKAKKTAKKTPYTSVLLISGREYKGKGKTIEEAITSINPSVTKGTGVLTIKKGKQEKQRILRPQVIHSIYAEGSPTLKDLILRNTISLFNVFND